MMLGRSFKFLKSNGGMGYEKYNGVTFNIHKGAKADLDMKNDYPGFQWKSEGCIDARALGEMISGAADALIDAYQKMVSFRDQRNLWLLSLPEEKQRAVLGGPDYIAQKVFNQDGNTDEGDVCDCDSCDDTTCPEHPNYTDPSQPVEPEKETSAEPAERYKKSEEPKEDELARKIVDLVKESGVNPGWLLMKVKELYLA